MPTSDKAHTPRNGVERAVVEMASGTSALQKSWGDKFAFADMAGAEWWIQDVAHDEPPKTFHTDCDMQMWSCVDDDENDSARNEPKVVHPDVASVLYLTNFGGPTAVFGQARHEMAGTNETILVPQYPREVAVAYPSRNRVLLCKGDRYHAVLHPPPNDKRGQRVTVLINCWRSRPRGPADLPDEFVTKEWVMGIGTSTTLVEGIRAVPHPLPVFSEDATFAEHAPAWRAQTVPSDLVFHSGEKSIDTSCGSCFVVRYKATREPESTKEQLEWPFENV